MLFSPFLVCEICGTRAKEQFCLPSQTTSVNRHHPAAGNWRFSVILPIRVSEDRWILCVFSHVAPSFRQNIQSQMVSKAVIECSPASAGLRQGKGQASGWKRGLPTPPSSAAGLRHGQEPQVPLASSSTSQAEASVPGLQLRQTGCPRGHVGRRRVT